MTPVSLFRMDLPEDQFFIDAETGVSLAVREAAQSRRYNFVAIIALRFSRSRCCAIIAISLLDTSAEVDE